MKLPEASPKQDGQIRNSMLILIAFATAFFPRVLETIGFPSVVNFLHFATVPLAFFWILLQPPVNDRQHVLNSKILLTGLFVLIGVATASAIINSAGVINVILSFLLLAEPFMLLLALVWTPITPENLKRFKKWIFGFACFHIGLALAQFVLLEVGILKPGRLGLPQDNIQGVFYLSGSGHVVGASVSIAYGLYYLISAKASPMWLRVGILAASIVQIQVAETKQVMFVSLAAFLLLVLVSVKNIKTTIQYLVAMILVGYAFWWATQNIEFFRNYNSWAKPELYGPEGEATVLKLSSIRIIVSHYQSALNALFGLGPGHTVGRLGGWMLQKYGDLLSPLGATIHPASQETWDMVWGTRLGPRSSMFSPLYGWAGIWGDIGWVGLGTYVYLSSIIWRRFCLDDFSKFLMLNIFIHGLIFSQMEEPGYMLFMAVLIGLRWHEIHSSRRWQNYPVDY
jgi:hypothetical protein